MQLCREFIHMPNLLDSIYQNKSIKTQVNTIKLNNNDKGAILSARDLTWSYSNVLCALNIRN